MEAMSSEGIVFERVEPPPSEELAVCPEDEADEPLQPPRMEELALGSADEAAGGPPGIPFVSTQVPPPVTEELAVGSGEAREEPLQRSKVLNRLQEPPVPVESVIGAPVRKARRKHRLWGQSPGGLGHGTAW